jgi:anti-anti-sigma factor
MALEPTPAGLIIQRLADIHIVEFVSSVILDQVQVEKIRAELTAIVEKSGQPRMVISFENVHTISSAVLGILMSLNKAIAAKKGELRLAHVGGNIAPVFKITKLDKILKIYGSADDACKKF